MLTVASLLLLSSSLCAAEQPGPLVCDYKYAWPRAEQVSLDGPWQLAWTDPPEGIALPESDKLEWIDVTVPCGVHWALYRAGKAPHPYVGRNIQSMRWIEDKTWWFRRRFVAPASLAGRHVRLIGDGVDYYAHYWLNGRYLGRSEGAFGTVKIGLENLRIGAENELLVRVDCGGYKLGREGGAPRASLIKSELWSGWDQGATDMNTVGIWQSVRLVPNGWPTLERPFARTLELSDEKAHVRVTTEVCTIRQDEAPCEVRVTVRGQQFDSPPVRGSVRVAPGSPMALADVDLEISQPRLWWPNGLGEQPMYEAEIELVRDDRVIDRLSVPFGIRTVERRPGGARRTSYAAREWVFYVNGRPMFVKGTNWMPIDALANVDRERYEWLLSAARDAGIQMIRVWGGGNLETDDFYELCDRYGIMIWQDFPLNVAWRAGKIDRDLWRTMVMWQMFRLRNHPSLVFWCGGNEFPPDDPANRDLVATIARYARILDGTRPFMGASPDEGDIHGYRQWDASWAWRSELMRGPFISEWGSHGMPSAATYRKVVREEEADAVIGPVLLKMDKKLLEKEFPEIAHHWIEFNPARLPQMLARGSAYDDLASVPLGRFSEAVAAGSAEFYKYSAEASRSAWPDNGGLLYWVWKRPWPAVAIQICDGLGQPIQVYYDVKRAYGSPWPCLVPPHLNYAPGDEVEMGTAVLTEVNRPAIRGAPLRARMVGPDLKVRKTWDELPPLDVPEGPEAVSGPSLSFAVPEDFARSFFFVVLELFDAEGKQLARNAYTFRCPPQLEDAAFRKAYRAKPAPGLRLDQGPWLRPQLEKTPTKLEARVLADSVKRESATRASLAVEVKNAGHLPAVMASIGFQEDYPHVADDGFFWLEPGEQRVVYVRVRLPSGAETTLTPIARAWNSQPVRMESQALPEMEEQDSEDTEAKPAPTPPADAVRPAAPGAEPGEGFAHFVTRQGDRLMDGERPWRFVGANMPGLVLPYDYWCALPERMVLPTPWEQEDGLKSLAQMNLRCVRTWNLPIRAPDEDKATSWKHVLGPGEFNDEAFRAVDHLLALANKHRVRVMFPLTADAGDYLGGIGTYAAHRGKPREAFYTDPQLKEDYKATLRYVLQRKNTVTGVRYRDDKAIFAWQFGNEMDRTKAPPGVQEAWQAEMAAFVKRLDPNHLVAYGRRFIPDEPDPNVDVVVNHYYGGDWVKTCRANRDKLRGKRPYVVSEFGLSTSAEQIAAMLREVEANGTSGAMIWSMYFHHRDGGFWWHAIPTHSGGSIFSYHWPGFPIGEPIQERAILQLLRAASFRMEARRETPRAPPDPPELLPFDRVPMFSWRGSAGADRYEIQRAEAADGPWTTLAKDVSDSEVAYRPLWSDTKAEPGRTYFYRVVAHNVAGPSKPSAVVGPVRVEQVCLADELADFSLAHAKSDGLELTNANNSQYGEYLYRAVGDKGQWIAYRLPGPIKSFRVIGFSGEEEGVLAVSVSADGAQYQPVAGKPAVRVLTPYRGKPTRQVTLEGEAPAGATHLKVEWLGPGELDRVEVLRGGP